MDTIDSRIQQFLNMEGLTPGQFADQLGIQRSGISHLLSGRNKPSFDFITKMLSTYPNLQADWLLLGHGKPYKDQAASPAPAPTPAPAPRTPLKAERPDPTPSLFQGDSLFGPVEPVEDDLPEFPEPIPSQPAEPAIIPENKPVPREIPVSQPRENRTEARKTVSRITIFYSDGTFEEH